MTLRLSGLCGLTFALFATACASPVPEPEAQPQDQTQANAAPLCEVKPRIGSNIVARDCSKPKADDGAPVGALLGTRNMRKPAAAGN
jgi:hypothetical protein